MTTPEVIEKPSLIKARDVSESKQSSDLARVKRVNGAIADLPGDRLEDIQGKVLKRTKELEETFGDDIYKVRLYHAMAGSTPSGECQYWDFGGDWSVERFMVQLYAQIRMPQY
jgi:hypothetical protein